MPHQTHRHTLLAAAAASVLCAASVVQAQSAAPASVTTDAGTIRAITQECVFS